MIKVTVVYNMDSNDVIVEATATPRQVLEDARINYGVGRTALNSRTLSPAELDKSFAELGVTDDCFLSNVAKVECA